MLNSPCKMQGEFFMKKGNENRNLISYLSGFAFGYFITDFIFSLFIPRKK